MATRAKTNRIRRRREDPVMKLARSILPEQQVRPGLFVIRDVANHTDEDQRTTMRSGDRRTIERKTHIQALASRGVIEHDHVPILQWYADQHEMAFATVGCTANYMGAGGGGWGPHDLLARYKAQAEARQNYAMARAALPSMTRGLFERVVIGQMGLALAGGPAEGSRSSRYSRLSHTFRLAVSYLTDAIGHMVERA